MEKLAVFGGTFNPIHNGHLHLARQFAQKIGADRVVLVPTAMPPHKTAADLAPAADRLEMCRLAAQKDRFEVSSLEIRRGGRSYTSDTLRSIKKSNPGSELFFLMGEDMFLTLLDWHEPEIICSLATICAAPRSPSGCSSLRAYAERVRRIGAKIMICNIKYLPVSSTAVRSAVRGGRDLSNLVPPPVAAYIYEHRLYSEGQNESGKLSNCNPKTSGGQPI